MKKKYNDDEYNEYVNKIKFLEYQYICRKFYTDLKSGIIDSNTFNNYYLNTLKSIAKQFLEYYIEVDGIIRNKYELIENDDNDRIRQIIIDSTTLYLDDAIILYNNTITDNPKYLYKYHEIEIIDRNISEYIISIMPDEIKYLRDICIKYGHFPHNLTKIQNPFYIFRAFLMTIIPEIGNFIMFDSLTKNVRTNFVSETKKSYFEKDDGKTIYIYFNTFSNTDINEIFKKTPVMLSRKGKKNFKRTLYIDNEPNVQLCINSDCVNNWNKLKNVLQKEILNDIECTIICAILYFNHTRLNNDDIRKLQWRIYEAKDKKISYIMRFVGLHIWDCVHILQIKLSKCINMLLEYSTSNEKENIFDELYDIYLAPSNDNYTQNNYNWQDTTKKWAKLLSTLYRKRQSATSGNEEFEYNIFDQEYRLACKCIDSLSICVHGGTNKR